MPNNRQAHKQAQERAIEMAKHSKIKRIELQSCTDEYPKLGTPLHTDLLASKRKQIMAYLGHIKTDENNGIYTKCWFDTESSALEYSAEIVVEMRKNRKNKKENPTILVK